MTDEQIESAFNDALRRWQDEHGDDVLGGRQMVRYFFFAGSEFGLASAKEIYSETFQQATQ